MNKLIIKEKEEDVAKKEDDIFKANIAKFTKGTYEISNLPGIDYPNKWMLLYTDSMLALLKYFKRKYQIKGKKEKVEKLIDQIGSEKSVRITTVYSPYKIVRTSIISAKAKNKNRPARVFQYNNKFFPFDREDLHLMTVDVVKENKLIGPCMVINLTGATEEDFGNILGDKSRTQRVFKFLEVPKGYEDSEDKKDNETDAKQRKGKDSFKNKDEDEPSLDLSFDTPVDADVSINKLKNVDDTAHKVRATLLMIRRAKGALENVKDPEKKKNLQISLKKFIRYKNQIIHKD